MSQPDISHNFKSDNFDNRKAKIEFIILHYTETDNLAKSVELLTDNLRKVSSHYLIDTNGEIYNLVCETKRAWHAGISNWDQMEDINSRSIGIEIVNSGEKKFANYPKSQISSLINLLKYLMKKFGIPIFNILGHSDIAPLRKIDPGKFFPWKELAKKNVAVWIEEKPSYKFLNTSQNQELIINLREIGYPYLEELTDEKKIKKVLEAFHRRFLPELIGRVATSTTLKISYNLLKIKKS